jgi:hypothetical protein
MSRRPLLIFFALGLAVAGLAASFQSSPGYMDADYHTYMGQRLAAGQGFSEEVLWNYLDDPTGLPHPSHAYWPPLPSLLAALGIWLLPGLGAFAAARLPFILIAAALPPLSYLLAQRFTEDESTARFAGALALFPAFYLPYVGTTDSFTPTMLLGGLFFLVLAERETGSWMIFLALGLIAGFLHLARAEGFVWLLIALLAPLMSSRDAHSQSRAWRPMLLIIGGYLLVMGPWFLRNLSAFGTPLAPGAARSLWLTNYDQLFAYPASQLRPAGWFAAGWGNILADRLSALGQNALTALAVQWQIYLAPLVLAGAWSLRRRQVVCLAALAWLLLFLIMSVLFPYSGARGGFFHAAAPLQPLVWALAAIGLKRFVAWGVERRGWQPARSTLVFRTAALLFGVLLSTFVFTRRVAAWDSSARHYADLGAALEELGASPGDLVLANNPPGFALATGHPAIALPDGDLEASAAAAAAYGADYLLLEANHPAALDAFYQAPSDAEPFHLLSTTGGTYVFGIIDLQ